MHIVYDICKLIISDIPKAIFRVLRTPVYPIVVLALGIFLFGVMGGISFGPKYMENQFNIPTWQANIILGKIFIVLPLSQARPLPVLTVSDTAGVSYVTGTTCLARAHWCTPGLTWSLQFFVLCFAVLYVFVPCDVPNVACIPGLFTLDHHFGFL